jgi:hypothetical protein
MVMVALSGARGPCHPGAGGPTLAIPSGTCGADQPLGSSPISVTGLTRIYRHFYDSFDAVPGCRIGTSPFGKCMHFDSPPVQQPWQAKISFIAARLVINSVLLIALLREVYLRGSVKNSWFAYLAGRCRGLSLS